MNTKKQTILVVEDELELSNIIRTILIDAGFDVILTENGSEGLAQARRALPDLILCDIQMPSMNGYELLDAVKIEPDLAKIPFVFMTGVNTGRYDLRRGMDLGADDYLNKPFTAENLLEAINARLKKKEIIKSYFESTIEKIHTGVILLLPNDLQILVMDILEHAMVLQNEKNISPEAVKKRAQNIYASGKRLGHLHENILLFAMLQLWVNDQEKIEALRQDFVPSYVSVLRSIIDDNARAEERKNSISVQCADSALQISPAYFGKVMDEVIDNACKFSDPGSPIEISSNAADTHIKILIRDHGRGMTKDEINTIGSLLNAEQRTYGQIGTGMGLTIAKTIVELHGGAFEVVSAPNQGTSVIVSFPKA